MSPRSLAGSVTVLLLALCVSLSCADGTSPAEPTFEAATRSPQISAVQRGCARFAIQLQGRDVALVRAEPAGDCGPVQPVIDSARFDRTRGLLRLAVSLRNAGTQRVRAPAWLFAWDDSLIVLDPPGLARNRHEPAYLGFRNADSTVTDGGDLAGAQLWRYDTLLAAGGGDVLPGGARSAPRWIELRGHQGVLALRLTLLAQARQGSTPVPPTAPDTVPQGLYDSANVVPYAPGSKGGFLRGILLVVFEPEATPAERQEAIDAVDGEVVGGIRMDPLEGYYVVRVQGDTFHELLAVIARLEALPQVEFARPDYVGLIGPAYLAPRDGAAWRVWRVDPGAADGANWAPEAVAAPLAWGCSVGDTLAPVAVVDNGFADVAEVSANLAPGTPFGLGTGYHGHAVVSVLAARGNDSVGISGMMWTARVRAYDHAAPGLTGSEFDRLLQSLDLAARNGARAVNVSHGRAWAATATDRILPTTARRSPTYARTWLPDSASWIAPASVRSS